MFLWEKMHFDVVLSVYHCGFKNLELNARSTLKASTPDQVIYLHLGLVRERFGQKRCFRLLVCNRSQFFDGFKVVNNVD